jgi:hypothetical protein
MNQFMIETERFHDVTQFGIQRHKPFHKKDIRVSVVVDDTLLEV